MTAETFLNCLRRFIARQGKPREFTSDNAGQFILTEKVLKIHWNSPAEHPGIQSYLSSKGISWRYIPELSPWMGGFYERLVGMVKRGLKKALGKRLATSDHLHTIITEVEAVLNSRPLMYLDSDLEDQVALTPGDLLGCPKNGVPELDTSELNDKDFVQKVSHVDTLVDSWRKNQEILNQFWKLWRDPYLLGLRERQQFLEKTGRIRVESTPKIGEVVLIWQEHQPQGTWKMDRVVELIPSEDGKVRSAKLQLPDRKTLKRSVTQLYPLECQLETGLDTLDHGNDGQGKETNRDPGSHRPERKAKDNAKMKISKLFGGCVAALPEE